MAATLFMDAERYGDKMFRDEARMKLFNRGSVLLYRVQACS